MSAYAPSRRARQPPAGDRGADDEGLAASTRRPRGRARRTRAAPRIDEHVGAREQPQEGARPRRREVEETPRLFALRSRNGRPLGRVRAMQVRRVTSSGVAGRWFDLDDVGAEVGEETAGVMADRPARLDDADVAQGSRHGWACRMWSVSGARACDGERPVICTFPLSMFGCRRVAARICVGPCERVNQRDWHDGMRGLATHE